MSTTTAARRKGWLGGIAVIALLAIGASASAHTGAASPPSDAAPTIARKLPEGPRGRLEVRAPRGQALRLVPLEGSLMGAEIEIANTGEGPLTVERVGFMPGREGSPRTPPGVSAALSKGRDTKLAPGETRLVEIRWRSELSRTPEMSGFVEIRSDSAAPSATAFDESAVVGVLADRRSGLGRFLVGGLVLLPLLVLALAAAAGKVRALGDRVLARAAAGVFLVQAALSILAAIWIDPRLTSLEGNDGVQYLEHLALPGGLRWTVGLDGASIPFLVATTLVLAGAAVAGRRVRLRGRSFFAGLALLGTSTVGTIVSLDARLLVGFAALGAPAAYLLVAASTDERARRAATGAAAILGASAAVLGAVLWGLAAAAGPGLDFATGRSEATWMLSELARVEWTSAAPRIIGLHPALAAWALPIAALVLRAGMLLPFATGRALEPAPAAATAALIGTSLTGLGLVVVRLALGPGASAASTVAAVLIPFGLLIAAVGVVDGWRAKDLVRLAAASVQVQGGLALAALATRTPQGIGGAATTLAWHGMAAALLVLVAGSLRDRVGTSEPGRLGGLRADMPRAALISGVAMLAAGGLPGLAGFWGPLLSISGLAPRTPLLALAATAVLIAQAVTLARAHVRTFHGELSPEWKESKELEPFGGRFPDLRARELLGLAPLAAALLVLGLHPRALLAPSEPKILELHRRVDPASPSQIAANDDERPRTSGGVERG